jgi:hypothetical protein
MMWEKKIKLSLCVEDLDVGRDNIQMDLKKIGLCNMDWIRLVQDRD